MAASSKEKRVSVGGLAAVFDYINNIVLTNKEETDTEIKEVNDKLGGATLSVTEDGLLHIETEEEEETEE